MAHDRCVYQCCMKMNVCLGLFHRIDPSVTGIRTNKQCHQMSLHSVKFVHVPGYLHFEIAMHSQNISRECHGVAVLKTTLRLRGRASFLRSCNYRYITQYIVHIEVEYTPSHHQIIFQVHVPPTFGTHDASCTQIQEYS